jgi:endonuclease/exonuclease/phosphatase family metal-dependent hydrolase
MTAHTPRSVVAAVATALLLAGPLALADQPLAHALPSGPSGFKVVSTAANAIAVSWNKVDGADGYRVSFAVDGGSAKTWDVTTTNFALTKLTGNPTDTSTARLTPSTRYQLRVKAIAAGSGYTSTNKVVKDVTSYTSWLSATTDDADALPEVPPVSLKATQASGTSLYLSWTSRGPGLKYRVRYGTDRSLTDANSDTAVFSVAGGELTGLSPNTTYYYKVRALELAGSDASAYSAVASGTTPGASFVPGFTVASYNILKTGAGPSWTKRRAAVAANILAAAPDVLGAQEALQTKVAGVKGSSVPQWQDLLDLLGSKYKVATTTNSQGTRLYYNSSQFSLVKSGAKGLTTIGTYTRYAVWAILQDKISGKQGFFVSTHLEPGSNTSAAAKAARKQQAAEILALVKAQAGDLSVIVVGDLNSSRSSATTNGAYQTFRAGGLLDPVGNSDDTWFPSEQPVAEHLIDVAYNSFNALERRARRTAYPVGTSVDQILVSSDLRVAQRQTVVSVDRNRKFVGTIPSDHNMITATIHFE